MVDCPTSGTSGTSGTIHLASFNVACTQCLQGYGLCSASYPRHKDLRRCCHPTTGALQKLESTRWPCSLGAPCTRLFELDLVRCVPVQWQHTQRSERDTQAYASTWGAAAADAGNHFAISPTATLLLRLDDTVGYVILAQTLVRQEEARARRHWALGERNLQIGAADGCHCAT